MRIPIYQLDAFADRLFAGNPAAVCPLPSWLSDERLQAIAAENNLSETAFLIPQGEDYALRWFTPAVEVDLCGHATLASAEVVFRFLRPELETVHFHTRQAGTLSVRRAGDRLLMDFPARPPRPVAPHPKLVRALGVSPREILAARDYFVVLDDAGAVRAVQPDFAMLKEVDRFAVIITAPGEGEADFVSRFFAPSKGVDEDPATGSAHSTLIPYWAKRLGKTRLIGHQLSKRGAQIYCEARGDRVEIGGHTVLYLEGRITV
jgi:PhzF family phenazine biosynthesis protein